MSYALCVCLVLLYRHVSHGWPNAKEELCWWLPARRLVYTGFWVRSQQLLMRHRKMRNLKKCIVHAQILHYFVLHYTIASMKVILEAVQLLTQVSVDCKVCAYYSIGQLYSPNPRLFAFRSLRMLCKSPRASLLVIAQHPSVSKMVNRLRLGLKPIHNAYIGASHSVSLHPCSLAVLLYQLKLGTWRKWWSGLH